MCRKDNFVLEFLISADKTILWLYYLHIGISYIGKMAIVCIEKGL